jgi:predicted SPOUT superfamily RNA methylase MTH1
MKYIWRKHSEKIFGIKFVIILRISIFNISEIVTFQDKMSQTNTRKEYFIQMEIRIPELTDYGKEIVFRAQKL